MIILSSFANVGHDDLHFTGTEVCQSWAIRLVNPPFISQSADGKDAPGLPPPPTFWRVGDTLVSVPYLGPGVLRRNDPLDDVPGLPANNPRLSAIATSE